MYNLAFSVMDLIQIAGCIIVPWFCYKVGERNGVMNTLEALGVIPTEEEEQQDEEN